MKQRFGAVQRRPTISCCGCKRRSIVLSATGLACLAVQLVVWRRSALPPAAPTPEDSRSLVVVWRPPSRPPAPDDNNESSPSLSHNEEKKEERMTPPLEQEKTFVMDNANDHDRMDRVIHVGMFGLGHRLSKLAAAHHLAERLGASVSTALVLEVRWNDCDGDGGDAKNNIFRRLFAGSNEIPILRGNHQDDNVQPRSRSQSRRGGKTILVRNDVHGYYAGQAYKNFQIPIDDDSTLLAWRDKLESDRRLFLHLRERFMTSAAVGHNNNSSSSSSSTHGAILRDFQKRHMWEEHHVIGVHIRAGNGETGHFADAQRAMMTTTLDHSDNFHNNSTMVIPRLLEQLMDQLSSSQKINKPFLIFVATDTVEWVEWLQTALLHVNVISFPQPRVDRGKGVSFSQWKGVVDSGTRTITDADADPDNEADPPADRCYAGWVAAATDMFLLAATDTLVATTRSTFTQILPLALVLTPGGGQGTFCEIRTVTTTNTNTTAATTTTTTRGLHDHHHRMACFTDLYQWLWGNDTDGSHKVMVHLPDVAEKSDRIFDDAQQFLVGTTTPPDDGANNDDWRLYYYGRKYNPRYREKRPFRSTWTYIRTGQEQ
jgi:hypothetical protein